MRCLIKHNFSTQCKGKFIGTIAASLIADIYCNILFADVATMNDIYISFCSKANTTFWAFSAVFRNYPSISTHKHWGAFDPIHLTSGAAVMNAFLHREPVRFLNSKQHEAALVWKSYRPVS